MPNTTTLNENLRSPVDGTEFVRLATPGANWKAPLSAITPTFATADAIYYVSTTGSDSNDGLTVGTPWATLQHAINVIDNIDWGSGGGFRPTINFAAGTYNAANQGFDPTPFSYGTLQIRALRGNAGQSIFLVGDNTTPSNVVFDMTTSTWQFALLEASQINPQGIHFKSDNLVFATEEPNAHLDLRGKNSPNPGVIEVEMVAGSSGFVPVLFGTVRPGGSLLTLAAPGASLVSSFYTITTSGSFNVGDFQCFAGAVGGGAVVDFGRCEFHITTTFDPGTNKATGFIYLEQYAAGDFAPIGAFCSGNANVKGQGAALFNSASIQTPGPPTAFPASFPIGTLPAFVDRFSAWKPGTGSEPYTQILFPTHAGGLPDTTDLIDTAWGVFDAGVNGIWLAANKGGIIFKVQLI